MIGDDDRVYALDSTYYKKRSLHNSLSDITVLVFM